MGTLRLQNDTCLGEPKSLRHGSNGGHTAEAAEHGCCVRESCGDLRIRWQTNRRDGWDVVQQNGQTQQSEIVDVGVGIVLRMDDPVGGNVRIHLERDEWPGEVVRSEANGEVLVAKTSKKT